MPTEQPLVDVAQAMVAASAVDLLSDAGVRFPAEVVSRDGATVRGTVSQLDVQAGTRMSCRVMIGDMPHQVIVSVEEACGHFDKRAVRLAVVSSAVDPRRRSSPRAAFEVAATLTAGACERLAVGESLGGMMHDVSEGGVGVVVADLRPQTNDIYELDLRLFEGAIRQEIRVQSFRPGSRPGTLLLGCQFASVSAETLEVVKDLLARLDQPAPDAGPSLRGKLGMGSKASPSPEHRRRWYGFPS
jgi:PilZ domain